MTTEVMDMNTGEVATYTLNPFQAVIAAYAQRERRDWSTWDYSTRYGHLVKTVDSVKPGFEVVTCGNQTTLRDKSIGAHGWPLRTGRDGEQHLFCPKCGQSNITMSVQYPVYGTGSRGQGRLGDIGCRDVIVCDTCGHKA